MPNKTTIEWADYTSNPIRFRVRGTGERAWHCEKVSPGCAHCYAEALELGRFGSGRPFTRAGGKDLEAYLDEGELKKILTMKPRAPGRLGAGKPHMIFIGDMTDIFGDWVPDAWLDKLFAVMALRPDLIFQVLTKRAERMTKYFERIGQHVGQSHLWYEGRHGLGVSLCVKLCGKLHGPQTSWPVVLPNVWLGVSVEDQPRADERIPHLLRCPAAVRWLSCEPMLGPVDLTEITVPSEHDKLNISGFYPSRFNSLSTEYDDKHYHQPPAAIDWVVVGGESGPKARPMHPDWARSLRDQCQAAGVPFFFKQWGQWAPNCLCNTKSPCPTIKRPEPGKLGVMFRCGKTAAGRMLDGRTHDAYPEARA